MAAEKQQAEESFETLLAKLEEIVSQLEAGERPLDESLTLYESGVAALKRCHSILDKSEKRIRLLLQDAQGNPVLREAEIPENKKREAVSQKADAPTAPTTRDVQKKNKNSDQQPVDSEPANAQNPPSSPKLKSKPRPVSDSASQGDTGEPDPSRTAAQGSGGSLFGSAS